jgi:DNA/RNA-binding domain of Phe-tRNA-synthetase-like protein
MRQCIIQEITGEQNMNEAPMFQTTPAWQTAYPDACAGVLVVRDAGSPASHAALDQRRLEIEGQLRAQYQSALPDNEILEAYAAYYKRFKKTYHVKPQIESIALKGKSIPGGPALVQAMFMAEVKNMLLTAGHDLDTLRLPVVLDVAKGGETYTLLRGQTQQLKAGDMFMADGLGIISSIIYGPDQRTMIQSATRSVMYTVYALQGIPRPVVLDHLHDIAAFISLFSPSARVELLQTFA